MIVSPLAMAKKNTASIAPIPHVCWDGESEFGTRKQVKCFWHNKRIRPDDIYGNKDTGTVGDFTKALRKWGKR